MDLGYSAPYEQNYHGPHCYEEQNDHGPHYLTFHLQICAHYHNVNPNVLIFRTITVTIIDVQILRILRYNISVDWITWEYVVTSVCINFWIKPSLCTCLDCETYDKESTPRKDINYWII